MNIKQSITELIGHTPLLELNGLMKALDLDAHIIVKLEFKSHKAVGRTIWYCSG